MFDCRNLKKLIPWSPNKAAGSGNCWSIPPEVPFVFMSLACSCSLKFRWGQDECYVYYTKPSWFTISLLSLTDIPIPHNTIYFNHIRRGKLCFKELSLNNKVEHWSQAYLSFSNVVAVLVYLNRLTGLLSKLVDGLGVIQPTVPRGLICLTAEKMSARLLCSFHILLPSNHPISPEREIIIAASMWKKGSIVELITELNTLNSF